MACKSVCKATFGFSAHILSGKIIKRMDIYILSGYAYFKHLKISYIANEAKLQKYQISVGLIKL